METLIGLLIIGAFWVIVIGGAIVGLLIAGIAFTLLMDKLGID